MRLSADRSYASSESVRAFGMRPNATGAVCLLCVILLSECSSPGYGSPVQEPAPHSPTPNETAMSGHGPSSLAKHDGNGSDGGHGGNESESGHGGSGHEVERFQVLKVDWNKVSTPFTISCWILVASLAKIGFHFSNKLSSVFPESSLLIVLGIIVGVVFYFSTAGQDYHHMSANTFFYFLLPPIILESGYFMPNRAFFDNIGTILLYAVVGTLFNTLTIGFSLWGVANGLAGGDMSSSLPTKLLHCLLFSSLISAVDPVAVLAVFEEIHVNEVLHIVVFGESLLNDAVTVVLYHMFEGYSHMGEENIQVIDIVAGMAAFVVVGLGGTVIGVIFGLIAVFITRFTSHVRVIEPIFVFLIAYLSYLFAEMFHFSGIMSLTFCGIVMKQYVEFNISEKSQTTVKYFMKMLSSMSETIIFMFLGTSTIADKHSWDTAFIIAAVIFCLVYRAVGVFLLTAMANRKRMIKLSFVDQFVMAYGGLRGAVAFALAITLDAAVIPAKNLFVTTTIVVVLFTVFGQGITMKPLVNKLRVKKQEKRQLTMNEQINERLIDHLMAGVEDITGFHGDNWLRDKFEYYDNKYLRRHLLREQPKTRETGILRINSKLSLRDAMEQMHHRASSSTVVAGGLVAAQLNLLNEPSLTKIIRNWSNVSLQDDSTHPGGEPLAAMSENAIGTVIDMQALEATYSKKMADDSKIHHILSDNMIRLRKRWTKRKRHELDDVENHPPFHHNMRLHLRHIISQHQRKQGEKRSSGKRSAGSVRAAAGEPSAAETVGLLTEQPAAAPMAVQYSRAKNVTFCELAATEPAGHTGESKDFSVKFHVSPFDVKPQDDEEDLGITFKAEDAEVYPDEPPPSMPTVHVLPWRQGTAAATSVDGSSQPDAFASQLLLTAAAGESHPAEHQNQQQQPSFSRDPFAAVELPESASSSVLPWRQMDDSAPEVSHRAQSELPLAVEVRPLLLSGSGESEDESAREGKRGGGRSIVRSRQQPSARDSARDRLPQGLGAGGDGDTPPSESESTSTLQEATSSIRASKESVVSLGRIAAGGDGAVGQSRGGHPSLSGEASGRVSRQTATSVDADGSLPLPVAKNESGLIEARSRNAEEGADIGRRAHRGAGKDRTQDVSGDDDDDGEDDDDESTPLAQRLRRAKNSFEALHSRLLLEKCNDQGDSDDEAEDDEARLVAFDPAAEHTGDTAGI